ncbi:hypothetical protein [Streptomyces sp. SID3915]|uniref:hypothetical protein n=1 Tax=Streptomyces sp. SID3915 TaxID=2690263 RepID=UPI001F1A32AC|nr:hypothetical protein [Streptomyces sp. SID3915]
MHSPERDTGPRVSFNLRAYHEQAQRAQRVRHRVRRSSDVWLLLDQHAESPGVSERQVAAPHEVAMAGRVRRSRYEKSEGLNAQQATRDMQALVKAGVLTPVGRTKGRHYIAGCRFPPGRPPGGPLTGTFPGCRRTGGSGALREANGPGVTTQTLVDHPPDFPHLATVVGVLEREPVETLIFGEVFHGQRRSDDEVMVQDRVLYGVVRAGKTLVCFG